jgi:Uma2 family endonuclease
MAALPGARLVPVDEYLNTSYEHDLEFVDGVLVEKGLSTIFHQLLSAILLRWFSQYEKEFRIKAVADVRTQIIERARYRLPDVMVFTKPVRLGRVFTAVPSVVVEAMSPDDRQSDVLFRFADYEKLGVQHLIHMDPENFIAWGYYDKALVETGLHALSLPGRPDLPFDTAAIFEQLKREIAECESD